MLLQSVNWSLLEYESYFKEAAEEKSTETSGVESVPTAEAALASLSLEETKEEESEDIEATADATAEPLPSTEGATAAVSSEEDKKDEEKKDTKKKKNRCFVCKKKLGLTGFTCRCDRLFCAVHR